MTVAAFVAGAVLAGLGTRLAAGAFVAAAVLAAGQTGTLATVGTWTAALAAALVLLEVVPLRRLALPALGAAAVVAAGAAPNAAVVAGLWVAGTASAVLQASDDEGWRRAGVVLMALDLLLIAGIATTAAGGFQGWPATLGPSGAALLLASAALRAPLVAAPSSDPATAAGVALVLRAQVAVLGSAAIVHGGVHIAETAVVIGAAAFAAAPFARRRDVTDSLQELGLFAVATAGATLGWIAPGWAWGALAAGTLTHQLRFMVRGGSAGQWPDAVLRAGGLGLPFLPVVAAVLEGSSGVRGWPGGVLAVAMLAGLAGRTRTGAASRTRRRTTSLDMAKAFAVVALAVVAGLWDGSLTLPRPPAATPVAWPPPWAAAVVLLAAAAGSLLPRVVGSAKAAPLPALDVVTQRVAAVPLPSGPRAVWIALGVLAVAAAGVWVAGLARGFL